MGADEDASMGADHGGGEAVHIASLSPSRAQALQEWALGVADRNVQNEATD